MKGSDPFVRVVEGSPALAAVALGRSLRAAGLPATPAKEVAFARAAGLAGARDAQGLYWPARLVFVSSRDQVAAFDAVFEAVARGGGGPAGPRGGPARGGGAGRGPGGGAPGRGGGGPPPRGPP